MYHIIFNINCDKKINVKIQINTISNIIYINIQCLLVLHTFFFISKSCWHLNSFKDARINCFLPL